MNAATRHLALLLALGTFSHSAAAAPGDLDATFGVGGMVTTDFDRGASFARAVAVQDDGKIVVVGDAGGDFAVARYNADGSLDTTFSRIGKVTTNPGGRSSRGESVALQRDGKIVVAGSLVRGFFRNDCNYALLRYNADGSLDQSFNNTGTVIIPIVHADGSGGPEPSVAVQTDGKILVTGNSKNGNQNAFVLFRYNADGTLDMSFKGTGKVTTALDARHAYGNAIALQADGKILVAGSSYDPTWEMALVRYNTDGSLDTSFNRTGIVNTAVGYNNLATNLALQTDGKILVSGMSDNNFDYPKTFFTVVRFKTDGSLDASFNGTGKVITGLGHGNDHAYGLAVQGDGKIVVAGESCTDDWELSLARYNSDGSLDKGFHRTGTVMSGIHSSHGQGCAMQRDGRILVAGFYSNKGQELERFAVFRFEGGPTAAEPGEALKNAPKTVK